MACSVVLQHVWGNSALAEKFADEPPPSGPGEGAPVAPPAAVHSDKAIEPKPDPDKLVRNWLRRAEDFVALEVTAYLSQFFLHLRNLILFLIIAPFLMLLAVTSYPFQPQRLWLLLTAALIGITTATAIWIVIQIERNEVVSHIMSTTPSKLTFNWQFLGQLLLFAAPLLGVVVAASSDASDLVHAWVDPLIQALR